MPVRCVALLGPRGAGKSTLAPVLARLLGWPWADGDLLLAARVGVPAGTFLQQEGEERFRRVEEQVTAEALAASEEQVLALGGGAVLLPAVQRGLRLPDVFPVLLLAPVPVLVDRLRSAPRPALTALPPADEVAELLRVRLPVYRSLARLELDTARERPESCARAIARAIGVREA
jgi:shikimate kinase